MTEPILQLEKAPGFLRKISINVLNKDAAFTLFTLPIEGIPLSFDQLDAFMGAYTSRSWYEQRPDGSWHPMSWFALLEDQSISLDTTFACKTATLRIERSDYLFEEYSADEESDEDDDDGEDMRPAARISSLRLKPTPGGTTLVSFHMQVRPTNRKSRDALLEHMYRHLEVTFGETSVVAKKAKQSELPLTQPQDPPAPSVEDQTGHQSPSSIESRGGDAIDAENHSRHPEASGEVMGVDADPDSANGTDVDSGAGGQTSAPQTDPAEDLARFEEGARARAAEFQQRATGSIDGTTMRSRRRRVNDAH